LIEDQNFVEEKSFISITLFLIKPLFSYFQFPVIRNCTGKDCCYYTVYLSRLSHLIFWVIFLVQF